MQFLRNSKSVLINHCISDDDVWNLIFVLSGQAQSFIVICPFMIQEIFQDSAI